MSKPIRWEVHEVQGMGYTYIRRVGDEERISQVVGISSDSEIATMAAAPLMMDALQLLTDSYEPGVPHPYLVGMTKEDAETVKEAIEEIETIKDLLAEESNDD